MTFRLDNEIRVVRRIVNTLYRWDCCTGYFITLNECIICSLIICFSTELNCSDYVSFINIYYHMDNRL